MILKKISRQQKIMNNFPGGKELNNQVYAAFAGVLIA